MQIGAIITHQLINQKLLINLLPSYTFLWLTSIFIFLVKRNLFHTNLINQRFWKRTLGIFWSLEFFLFFIYLLLWFASPSEVIWGFDYYFLFLTFNINYLIFFKKILVLILLIFSAYLFLLAKLYNSMFLLLIVLGHLVVISLSYLEDLYQLVFLSSKYVYNKLVFELDLFYWNYLVDVDKTRTKLHYFYLISVLKFWHNYFIVVVFLLILSYLFTFITISLDFFSLNKFNTQFVYLFFFIFYLYVGKSSVIIMFFYVYKFLVLNKFFYGIYIL